MRHRQTWAVVAALGGVLAVGCAAPKYAVVTPPTLAGDVAADGEPRTIERDGLGYEVRSADGRLVVRVANRRASAVALTGESAIVDARGRPSAVPPKRLPPGGTLRLLVPPTAVAERSREPVVPRDVGVGSFDDAGVYVGTRGGVPESRGEVGPTFRWGRGETVRLRLVYEQPDAEPIEHEFTFRRP